MKLTMPSGNEVDLVDLAAVDTAIKATEDAETKVHADLVWLKKKRKQWADLPIVEAAPGKAGTK